MSEKTKKDLVAQPQLSDEDLSLFLGEATGAANEEEQLLSTQFASLYPGPAKVLLKLPDVEKANQIAQQFDTAMFNMEGGSERYELNSIKLIKKMNPNSPLFQIGSFRVGSGTLTPTNSFKFLPLYAYPNKVYFAKYGSTDRPRAICSSTTNIKGLFKGLDPEDTPYVRDCSTCNFKEWGCDSQGNKIKGSKERPKCRQQWTIIGVTPDFNELYEIVLSGYCLGSRDKLEAHNKFISMGRMAQVVDLDIDMDKKDLKKVRVHKAIIDVNSKWLEISGTPIRNAKGEVISAGTIVQKTNENLTKEEIIFSAIFFLMGSTFINYIMDNFQKYLNSTSGASAIDVETSEEMVEDDVSSEDIDIVDDMD